MTDRQLSRLEQVDLRKIWLSEPDDFTPWLSNNLDFLGDTLGIKLELEEREKDVGPYRADIVCKEEGTDNWVLIENQLEATDHTHLGQILTYAAGLNAVTIAWIARRFTDEHQATLDWLNENSSDNLQFFGLEIEVWRIGDSPYAPKFNIVAKPNTWTKGGPTRTQELSPGKRLQLGFWIGFRKHVLAHGKLSSPTRPAAQNWMNMGVGRSGFHLAAIASLWDSAGGGWDNHELRAELVINDKDYSKQYFQRLESQEAAIRAEMGEPLTWYNPLNARVCRIFVQQSTHLEDLDAREEQYAWLLEKLEKLHEVFADRVRELKIPESDS